MYCSVTSCTVPCHLMYCSMSPHVLFLVTSCTVPCHLMYCSCHLMYCSLSLHVCTVPCRIMYCSMSSHVLFLVTPYIVPCHLMYCFLHRFLGLELSEQEQAEWACQQLCIAHCCHMSKGDGCKSETETDAAERIQSLFPGGGGGGGGGGSFCMYINTRRQLCPTGSNFSYMFVVICVDIYM